MHCLEDSKVPLADRLRIELLQSLPKEIHCLTLASVLANLLRRRLQNFGHGTRTLGSLRSILADVLHDRPEIQARPPIDVPHVGQKHMRFEAVTKGIVPRKNRVPSTLSVAFLQAHLPLNVTAMEILWKTVAAIITARLPSRARIGSFRRQRTVTVMSSTGLNQRSNEPAQRTEI